GRPAHEIGEIASTHRIPLHELSPRRITLEEAFMQITRNAVEYGTPGSAAPRTSAPLESVR
ncbi:ABC transporter ATP-binding protein, partial [Streptomyces sp. NPDC057062]